MPGSSWKSVRQLVGDQNASILDVGCADGDMVEITGLDKICEVVGVDLHFPYLKRAKTWDRFSSLLLCSAEHLPFRDKSFDVVMCLEVIEHFDTKEIGRKVIQQLEAVARRRVIISTPLGLTWQEEYGGNIHQEHKVGWRAVELARLGYQIHYVGVVETGLIRMVKRGVLALAGNNGKVLYNREDIKRVQSMKLLDLLLRVPYYLLGCYVAANVAGHMICVRDL